MHDCYIMQSIESVPALGNDLCCNLSRKNSLDVPEMAGAISLLGIISTVTICGIGTILNSLIIIVIVYGKMMKTSVFMILLLVLAVFDNLTLGCFILIKDGIYDLIPLSSSIWLCRTLMFGTYWTTHVSSRLIVFISVERYIAIFLPLQVHFHCTVRKSVYAISILVIAMCIIDFQLLFTCNITTVEGTNLCYSFDFGSLLETLYCILLASFYSIMTSCIISCKISCIIAS